MTDTPRPIEGLDGVIRKGRRYTVDELEGHRIARVRIEKTTKAEGEAEAAKGAGN